MGLLLRFLKVLATAAILTFILFVIQASFIYYSINRVYSTAQACWSVGVGQLCDVSRAPLVTDKEIVDLGGEYFVSFIKNKILYRVTLRDVATKEERTMVFYYFAGGDGKMVVLRYQ